MSTRECAKCARPFRPSGKSRYCSTECRCGTDAGYNAGCRCAGCRRAHSMNHKRLRWHANPHVPALGTHRRVQALACLGWSTAELSRLLGKHRSYVLKLMHRPTLDSATVLLVRNLFDRLCMTPAPVTAASARTIAHARRQGWVPPLAWDRIDDPDEHPTSWEYQPLDRRTLLEDLAADGLSVSEVCRRLDITRGALQHWCGVHDMHETYRVLASREHLYAVNHHMTQESA